MDRIILFDGICKLCNRSIQFIIRHDPQKKFKLVPFQSEKGEELVQKYNLKGYTQQSFILLQEGKTFSNSTAALLVAKELSGGISLLYFFIIVPAFIRNIVYNIISKNRYRWFGKTDKCMVPTAEILERFII